MKSPLGPNFWLLDCFFKHLCRSTSIASYAFSNMLGICDFAWDPKRSTAGDGTLRPDSSTLEPSGWTQTSCHISTKYQLVTSWLGAMLSYRPKIIMNHSNLWKLGKTHLVHYSIRQLQMSYSSVNTNKSTSTTTNHLNLETWIFNPPKKNHPTYSKIIFPRLKANPPAVIILGLKGIEGAWTFNHETAVHVIPAVSQAKSSVVMSEHPNIWNRKIP